MTYAQRRNLALAVLAAFIAIILLSGCGTTQRALPAYERPLAKTDFQNVRTTAYTHTEADHREYSNHNALGGELHAAGPPSPPLQPFSMEENRTVARAPKRAAKPDRSVKRAIAVVPGRRSSGERGRPPQIGSAAADWSRWPAGTVFRLLSTGQNYRVEDYGWAEILKWGDPQESLQFLQRHQDYKHIRRMVLELEGRHKEAAALQ